MGGQEAHVTQQGGVVLQKRRFAVLFIFLFAFIPRPGWAQITPAGGTAVGDDTQPPSARVGAVIYADYTHQSEPKGTDVSGNTISPSSFNVTRTYLNITGNISHIVSYRITPDINSTRFQQTGQPTNDSANSLNGSYVFRVKYAFAQIGTQDWTGNWTGSWVRLGVQQTPFVDFQEGIYRYRFQGTIAPERDGGMSSSDAGVSFHTNLPNGYGDAHIGLYNGENYNKAELNDQKALQVRGTVRPVPTGNALARGFRFSVFHINDNYAKDLERNRTIISPTLEQVRYTTAFEYYWRTDQSTPTAVKTDSDGWSFWVTPFLKEKGNGLEGLLRWDSFRPDSDKSDQRQNRFIGGVAYWFPHPGGAGTAAVLLDYEQVTFKNLSGAKQERIFVHGMINF